MAKGRHRKPEAVALATVRKLAMALPETTPLWFSSRR